MKFGMRSSYRDGAGGDRESLLDRPAENVVPIASVE
jgi:hypothetical protein